jgi:hypothetical protein
MALDAGDLKDLVYPIFEIDSYRSKMGDDKNIVVMSFTVQERAPAEDLVNFLEKGYEFILDADLSAGEQEGGVYRVFVEMERDKKIPLQILEILDGVQKLCGQDFKFRYYKSFKSLEATDSNLEEAIPLDGNSYEARIKEQHLNNFKNFFNKSFLDSVEMHNESLQFKKAFTDPLTFKVIEYNDKNKLNINESFDVNAYPEILFLTKYIGDYNISKYGDKLVFENEGKALVLKRI